MANDLEIVLDCIRELMRENAIAEDAPLAGESPLVGVLDSMILIQLVYRLEDRFGIRFEQEDLTETHWASPRTIVGLVGYMRTRAAEDEDRGD